MQRPNEQLIGESSAFQSTLEQASRAANLNRPVLIIGERGTGKEHIAARLHYLSKRWQNRLVKTNCATLTESLLETELFGHEAGAFTGAVKRHIGRFELADGGSLFLDELAHTSARLQEKLLRAIEYGEIERVGSNHPINVDVRIIAATNEDLPSLVEQGKFRADLLDRLAFTVITLPPLRARGEDILLLAEHFATNMAQEMEWAYFPGFTEKVQQQLLNYAWPGNVRELKNAVERAVFHWQKQDTPINHIEFDPFNSPYRPITNSVSAEPTQHIKQDLKTTMKNLEKDTIESALTQNQYNQKRTAESLGLSYHQLRGMMRKYHLMPGDKVDVSSS